MLIRHALVVAAAALALNAPALAQERSDTDQKFDAINPDALFKGVIREDDVTLLFKHLRESVAATARSEDTPESETLNRRSQEIGREMASRGGVLLDALLNAFEAAAKHALREGFGDAR